MNEFSLFIVRAIAGGTIVATIGLIGRSHAGFAGIIATFPVTIFLSLIILYRSGAADETIITFSSSAGLALVPTALALGAMALCLQAGQATLCALALAFVIWCAGAYGLILSH